jgi:predicted MPP superfamily phosphohydrolase
MRARIASGAGPWRTRRAWENGAARGAGLTDVPLRPLKLLWRRTIDKTQLVKVRLPVRRLPREFEGMVACQLSDFHVDRDEDLERLEKAVDAVNRQKPELVFLTGDYFSRPEAMRRYLEPVGTLLRRLEPQLAWFAVAGNHDHWCCFDPISERLRRSGGAVLVNEHRRVHRRAAALVVVGIDDLWSRRAEPARAFRGVRRTDCTVVLAHNPDTALYLRHLSPGVMLSGHTHGGVVRLPFYGSVFNSFLRLGRRFQAGLNRYSDFYIYTNRGLGTFAVRIRINCRPEVSRFTLERFDPIQQAATLEEAVLADR